MIAPGERTTSRKYNGELCVDVKLPRQAYVLQIFISGRYRAGQLSDPKMGLKLLKKTNIDIPRLIRVIRKPSVDTPRDALDIIRQLAGVVLMDMSQQVIDGRERLDGFLPLTLATGLELSTGASRQLTLLQTPILLLVLLLIIFLLLRFFVNDTAPQRQSSRIPHLSVLQRQRAIRSSPTAAGPCDRSAEHTSVPRAAGQTSGRGARGRSEARRGDQM